MGTLEKKLLETGMKSGHFVLASENHSAEKFEFDEIAKRWFLLRRTANALVDLANSTPEFEEFDTFVTVGNGANCLERQISRRVSKVARRPITTFRSTYDAVNEQKKFRVIGGNVYVRDKQILFVDDAYSHGTNMGLLSETIEEFGGIIVGAVTVLDRSPDIDSPTQLWLPKSNRHVPVKSIIRHPMDDWPAEECAAEMKSRGLAPELCVAA